MIDLSRDQDIPEQGFSMLTRKGFYKKDWETSPQEGFARAATCYSFGDYEFAQRIYDYASKGWFTNASPVLSNAVEVDWPTFTKEEFDEAGDWLEENIVPDGMPISCFLTKVPDSKKGLVEARSETEWLSMMGGGIGVWFANRAPDEKSTGVMAHAAGYDADTLAYKQKESRRGSIAAYLDIDHPEIMQFIDMRNPVGGDQNKKCFNLNNAVVISDKFMYDVIEGNDYELVDPKHGKTGRFLNAREVWEKILQMRFETGEPYVMWKDTVNRKIPKWIKNPHYTVNQSNLCVAPETLVLTDQGHLSISELEGQEVNVWNGKEFSKVSVVKTGENQELIKVVTDCGQEIECTPYHKFYVQTSYLKTSVVEKRAAELKAGDKLIKLVTPVINGDLVLEKAYQNGFFTGDGCVVINNGRFEGNRVYLYGEKRKLRHLFPEVRQETLQEDRTYFYVDGLQNKFFIPDASYTVKSRIEWLTGLLDSDGCVASCNGSQTLQIASTEVGFLEGLQLMLQTLGVQSKVKLAREAGVYKLPANDGTGGLKDFECKHIQRLLISGMGIVQLKQLGFNPHRLQVSDHMPNRNCENFVKVKEVVWTGRKDDTYCFNEPLRHTGVFNGLLTGQCSEITLWTSEKRTAVCCLSSLNLEKFEEWKDTTIVQDLVRYLDNVLEYFIRLAPSELKKAVYSASKERSLGLGTLGWHSYLQSKMIPFESGGFNSAVQHTHTIYGKLKKLAVEESLQLAKERGEAPDCFGSGMRNAHLFAIAPNASSSSLVGSSPSIEPWKDCCFVADGRAGAFLIKNKYLERVLEQHNKNTEAVWKSVESNDGSVQHLEFLSEEEKSVFKTSKEIDPMWIIEQAAARTPYICQSTSLNIFVTKDITKEEMSDIHMKAWEKGVPTLYYCRAEGADKAQIGTGGDKPLNAVPVRKKIEYGNTCLGCD
ncbi:MAG: ribonucleotide-diphosphate reductase subunit [Myoviridae sp. ctThM1]|nr:MAG: ribonucleotide-diphosphate reductase subunit [Myoviridae sp. ctThM1]